MENGKEQLLNIIKRFQGTGSPSNQTTLYPNITDEMRGMVEKDFAEFDPAVEEILVHYLDGPNYDSKTRWLIITNLRFYFRMFYFPYTFEVLDCIDLKEIYSLRIHRRCFRYSYVELNREKLGSLMLKTNEECRWLNAVIGSIITYIEACDSDKPEPYVDTDEWKDFENNELFQLARDYFEKTNLGRRVWGFAAFYYGPFIPKTKLELVKQAFADYDCEKEQPILFVDNSWDKFGNTPTSGLLITNKYLYYKLKPSVIRDFKENKISISQLKRFYIKCGFWGWLTINNVKLQSHQFTFLDKRDAIAFQKIINLFIKALAVKK